MKIKMLALLFLVSIAGFAQKRFVFVTITDASGAPLEGVSIVFTVDQHPGDVKNATTDSKGRVTFGDVKPGDVNIVANKADYLERILRFRTSVSTLREKQVFALYKADESMAGMGETHAVSGVLRDTAGNPIPEATIIGTIEGTPYAKETQTDANGHFEIAGPADNELKLLGRKVEYRDQINLVKVRDKPVEVPEFVLKTLDEAYAELGLERPKEEEITPEQEAVELYNFAVEAVQQGKMEDAERSARQALEKNPQQMESVKLLIIANHKLEDWPDVDLYTGKWLEAHPDDDNIIQIAAVAAEALGNVDKLKTLQATLKAKGLLGVDTLWNQAVDALNVMNDAAALPLLQDVIKQDPDYADAYFELGKLRVREYEFEDAILNLKLFLKFAKKDDKRRDEAYNLIETLSE